MCKNLPFYGTSTQNFANILSLNPDTCLFLFTTDKQHVCGEQKKMLAVRLDISVNFTDQTPFRLKSRKSRKMPPFLMNYFVPLKNCSKQ